MANFYILVSIFFNVIGQTFLKSGVNKLGVISMNAEGFVKAFTSIPIWAGLIIYAVSAVFWILSLSRVDLSYAYPMLSIGYVLVIFISWAFLGETISLLRIMGVVLITMGLFLVYRTA